MPINFTLTYSHKTNDVDDHTGDVAAVPAVGRVRCIPEFSDNRPVLGDSDGFTIREFEGRIDSDGTLKAKAGGGAFRLWANDPAFNLQRLTYRVLFDLTDPVGRPFTVTGGYFEAPSIDSTVDLKDVLQTTGTGSPGVTKGPRGYTPWFEKVSDGPPALYQAYGPEGPVGDPITLDVQVALLGGYEAETVSLLDRMTIQPSQDRRRAINTLIYTLKEHDLWDRIDGLYLFAAHSSQAALLNWKRNTANMTAVNSPTFTVDVGFTGDSVTSYLTNTSAATVNAQPTDVSMSLWLKTLKTSGSWDVSWSGWEGRITLGSNAAAWRLSQSTGDNYSLSNANQPGLHTFARSNDSEERAYKDGALAKSNTRAYNSGGTYTSTIPIYIGVTSGSSGFTNGTYSMFHYGASMTTDEAALFYNAVNDYMRAVGMV